mgnify:CR=1 FL=1
MTKEPARTSAPAVEQAARVLLCLGQNSADHMSLTDICKQVGIHKSKGLSILNALAKYDFVTRDAQTKAYSLGLAVMPLARNAREHFNIVTVSREYLQALADETRSSVLLGVISKDLFHVVEKLDGNSLLTLTVRQFQSLHITHGAHGKAIFAFLDDTEQQRILGLDQLLFHGEHDRFDQPRFKKEVMECRQKGFATDNGELTPGTRAIAAPVFDHQNQVIAGIVIFGTFETDRFDEFGKKTAEAARAISRMAGASL